MNNGDRRRMRGVLDVATGGVIDCQLVVSLAKKRFNLRTRCIYQSPIFGHNVVE